MNVLSMNNSQLLYKISNLQYSIRRKQDEYNNAIKTNDTLHIHKKKEALAELKTELDALISAFNAIPDVNHNASQAKPKKISRWLRFFKVKAATRNTK